MKPNRSVRLATLASLAIVVPAVSGCVGGRHPALQADLLDCGSLAGVFHNVGKNAKDPDEYAAYDLREFLLDNLVTTDELSPKYIKGHDVSVAIQHVGSGTLKFAVLDDKGSVVKTGTHAYYDSCSNGLLEKKWKEDPGEPGYVGSDQRNRQTLFVTAEGKLVVSKEFKIYGVFIGLPAVGGAADWGEFALDPRYDVRTIDF